MSSIVNGYTIEPGAILTGANLSSADLTGANLTGANLTNAWMVNADLTGATSTRPLALRTCPKNSLHQQFLKCLHLQLTSMMLMVSSQQTKQETGLA